MTSPEVAQPSGGWLRQTLRRLGSSQQDIVDAELQQDVRSTGGCCRVADAEDRQQIKLAGTLRHVTLRPRSGTPALEAELYDGSGCVTLVWLGRRRIAGIEPGVSLVVQGRLSRNDKGAIIYNPRYELRG